MTETQVPNRSYTFEDVWAGLMENREQLRETKRLIDDLGKSQKRLGKQMGDLHRRFGEMAEHLVAPSIARRFNELGFHFETMSPGGHRILDEQGNTKTQVDILLENGEHIIAVEIKATVRLQDIEHHVRRLEILREFRNKKHDERKIQGAIAGAIFGNAEKKAVIEAGFYALEQSGDTMKLEIPEGFVPGEW
ncbi:MAG: hypothetical protein LBG95_08900 [Treponema sp.]|jgi:hypothetical protein|nr:hypothetical protein [Treponema sp.]